MERLIDQFHAIVREFRLKRHDLLDYHNNKFDRDYVEFNVKVRNSDCNFIFDFFVFLLMHEDKVLGIIFFHFYLTISLFFY
jgi:hypothetical protein